MILNCRSALLLTLIALTFSACAPTISNRGNSIEPAKLAQVVVGESTREDVARILGSPTQTSTFDEKTWYYFGRSTKQYSFLDPEVIDQQAVEVAFNDEGIVQAVTKLDPKDSQDISPVARRTPTYGHETTILEQLVGNLGRPGGLAGKESKK